MAHKAWEKIVVDRTRFSANIRRSVPVISSDWVGCTEVSQSTEETSAHTICYLVHYFFPDKSGGTERFVLNLAKEQQALGNRVHVLTLGIRPLSEYEGVLGDVHYTELDVEGVPVTQMRYKRAPKGLYYDAIDDGDSSMTRFAKWFLESHKVDVVHSAYSQPFASFLRVCRQMNVPYVVTLTDFNIMCHYATLIDKTGQFCVSSDGGRKCGRRCSTYGVKDSVERYEKATQLLSGAAAITTPSKFVAEIIYNEFDHLEIQTIAHGIGEIFTNDRRRSQCSRFAYVGTLSPLKGVHTLIEAFVQVQVPDISLEIYGVGDPVYLRKLKSLAKGDCRITFHGGVSSQAVAEVYRQSDCVVVPSIWFETYNFVLREGLASGCLVIASHMGAMPEAVTPGRNGHLFPAGDVGQLKECLEKSVDFDWSQYQNSEQVTLSEECLQYSRIYQRIGKGVQK